jgi:hypothetical protein
MAEKQPRSYKYRLETDQGVFDIESPVELADEKAAEEVLHRLLLERQHPPAPVQPEPTLTGLATQVVGGLRDAGQGILDRAVGIPNVITEFISPAPPGPPGTRQRLVPEIPTPTLPDVDAPQGYGEQATRTATRIAAELLPVARPIGRALSGLTRFEAVPPLAETTRAVPSVTAPLSEGAQAMARMIGLTERVDSLALRPASIYRQRLEALINNMPEVLEQEGPVKELWQALEQQILRHR